MQTKLKDEINKMNKINKTIIGLHGLAGSGKDTVADYIVKKYNYKKTSFATPLKIIVSLISGWNYDFVDGKEDRQLRETLEHYKYNMTCRQMMQYIGTDLFRKQFNENIWINITKNYIDNHSENIIVTDCRFENEINLIKKMGGKIIIIKRNNINSVNKHESEKNIEIDDAYIIENNGTLEELYMNIDEILMKY